MKQPRSFAFSIDRTRFVTCATAGQAPQHRKIVARGQRSVRRPSPGISQIRRFFSKNRFGNLRRRVFDGGDSHHRRSGIQGHRERIAAGMGEFHRRRRGTLFHSRFGSVVGIFHRVGIVFGGTVGEREQHLQGGALETERRQGHGGNGSWDGGVKRLLVSSDEALHRWKEKGMIRVKKRIVCSDERGPGKAFRLKVSQGGEGYNIMLMDLQKLTNSKRLASRLYIAICCRSMLLRIFLLHLSHPSSTAIHFNNRICLLRRGSIPLKNYWNSR